MLREFIVLSQYLNFSTAAERLHMAQPRLSVHISELEKEVGFPLFVREKSLSLTPGGRRFLVAADRALGELEVAIGEGRKSGSREARTLTVMKPPYMESFPPAIPQGLYDSFEIMEQSFPFFSRSMPPTLVAHSEWDVLREGKSDICYVLQSGGAEGCRHGSSDGVVTHPLAEVPLAAWVREGHPLENRRTIELSDLADVPVLVPSCLEISSYRAVIEDLFEEAPFAPLLRTVFADSAEAYLVLPPKEDEIMILPDYLRLQATSCTKRLELAVPPAYLGVAHLKSVENPLAKKFIEVLLAETASS